MRPCCHCEWARDSSLQTTLPEGVGKKAAWRRLLPIGVCDIPKGQVGAARSVQWIHAEHGQVSNTASLTTANPQASSPARAGPGSVSLGASFRCRRERGENADCRAVAHVRQPTNAQKL